MNSTTIFWRAISFSQARVTTIIDGANQLLLLHHAIFMKHLANGLEVNISFIDKTEPYTLNKTSEQSRIAFTTTHCEKLSRVIVAELPPPPVTC